MNKYLIRLIGVTLLIYAGVSSIVGSGSSCDPPRQWVECRFGEVKCCLPEEPCCLPLGGSRYSQLAQVSKPDLTHTNLDGLVDFGQTKLRVEIPSANDYFETNLKGRVALTGGICPQPPCPLQVVLAELRPLQDPLTSAKGRSVSDVFVRNANPWNGRRLSDASIDMDAGAKLAIEAVVDGEYHGTIVNLGNEFKGALYPNVTRQTDAGPRVNNRMAISGQFVDEDLKVTLTLSLWATDCQPVVKPIVECRPNIESGLPGYVHFDSDFLMLGNLQSSQDLCDALLVPDYEDVCTSGGSAEFPTFTCQQQPLPAPSNKAEVAKLLKFYWKDANGTLFSTQYTTDRDQLPVFPVHLTVENKWGKSVSATVSDAPVCTSDVRLAPGACAWEILDEAESHQQSNDWCPVGAFLTALDLEGDPSYSSHDTPFVGYARCCMPRTEPARWASCAWTAIGARSHQQGPSWCADQGFLTALDLDSDQALSAYDSPIVGQARCCRPTGSTPAENRVCTWVEVGRRSHQRAGNWCPNSAYLVALDLDGDRGLSAYDAPVVGRALCCSFPETQ